MAVGGWPSSPQVGAEGFAEKQSSPMKEAGNRRCCRTSTRGLLGAARRAELSRPIRLLFAWATLASHAAGPKQDLRPRV